MIGRIAIMASFAAMLAVAAPCAPAQAQTTLRLDETGILELDPHIASDYADSILLYNVYDPLVFPTIDGTSNAMRPHLAERVDVDGTTYTIKLRAGVKFHSGNPLTADDIVFSMNRMQALNTGFSYLFTGWIDSIEARDPLTAVIKLKRPYSTFYSSLSRLGIVDRKLVMEKKEAGQYGEFGDYGRKFLNTSGAGTGAYRVESHKPDELTVMRKFDGYFLGVAPKAPDIVRFRTGLGDPTIVTLVQRKELEIANLWTSPETKRALLKMQGVRMLSEPGIAQFFVKMNTTRPPLDDANCRRALAYAFDYDTLRKIVEITPEVPGGKPSKGPLLEPMMGYDATMPDFKRDMNRARAELAKCKYKPGEHKLEITWMAEVPLEERFALLMQQNFGELGFTSEITRIPWTIFTQRVAKPETSPMFAQVYTNARTPDPDAYLYNMYHSSRHGQFSASEYFADKEVDALLDEGRQESDTAKRTEIYKKATRRIAELQPSIFGYQQVNLFAVRDVVSVPTLEKPAMNTGLMGANILFRAMEMR